MLMAVYESGCLIPVHQEEVLGEEHWGLVDEVVLWEVGLVRCSLHIASKYSIFVMRIVEVFHIFMPYPVQALFKVH